MIQLHGVSQSACFAFIVLSAGSQASRCLWYTSHYRSNGRRDMGSKCPILALFVLTVWHRQRNRRLNTRCCFADPASQKMLRTVDVNSLIGLYWDITPCSPLKVNRRAAIAQAVSRWLPPRRSGVRALIYHRGLYNRPEVAAVPMDLSST
jgi:hypothetical protein